MGNNTFQDYNDLQNPYGKNQPFGNQIANNTFQDYNDPQNPYGRNQAFGNQMGNNTFQDYNVPQNPYGRDQSFGNAMATNTFPDYQDPQNLKGKNQPFGNQMGNNTFQDYNDPQSPYGKNQPIGRPIGNNTFQDYNDPQNMYGPNQQAFGNQMGGSNTLQNNYNNPQNLNGNNQAYGNQIGNGNLPGQGSAIAANNQNIPAPLNSPGSPHQVIVTTSYSSTVVKELLQISKNNVPNITGVEEVTDTLGPTQQLCEILNGNSVHNGSVTTSDVKHTTNRLLDTSKSTSNPPSAFETTLGITNFNLMTISSANISKNEEVHVEADKSISSTSANLDINVQAETKGKSSLVLSSSKSGATDSFQLLTTGPTSETTPLWIDEWLDNKITFYTNIFENISSKPVLENRNGENVGAIENNTKTSPLVTSCISSTNPNEQLKSESEGLLTTAEATKTTSTKFETNHSFTADVEEMIKSTDSHLEMDKQKLEDLLSSIYISNKSSLNIKTALERLLLHSEDNLTTTLITTSASSHKEPISISSAATLMQNLPDVLTVNISGSPYILMKKNLLKLNSGSQNVQNELPNVQNVNEMNPFAQGIQESPNILNPFQNVMNPLIPQQNLYDPYANNLPPQPNPFMIPNNVQGQDYQIPFLNPVQAPQELNKSFSMGPYRQVYPSFVQPQLPVPPFPPAPVYLTQSNVPVPGI
uniref:Uncharacterized protein n=1 Tax=Cacopsylla melanoneura TaxID=428564 RepID=A0A8D8SDU5_9HEMI